ncbi:unnamed protein product [Lathyrus oleraceus]
MEFVVVIILFLSMFLVVTNIHALVECINDFDCSKKMCVVPRIPWCIRHQCECVILYG